MRSGGRERMRSDGEDSEDMEKIRKIWKREGMTWQKGRRDVSVEIVASLTSIADGAGAMH